MGHSFKVHQAFLKSITIFDDIIRINLHSALHQIVENVKHTPLEGGKCTAKAKRHPPVSIRAKWASEGGLLLVFYSNLNLKVSKIAIQEAIEWVLGNSLKKLINEGSREMFYSCHFIQPPVVYAYPPTCGKAGGHLLSFFIVHNGHL